jgi:hypothetical protein
MKLGGEMAVLKDHLCEAYNAASDIEAKFEDVGRVFATCGVHI